MSVGGLLRDRYFPSVLVFDLFSHFVWLLSSLQPWILSLTKFGFRLLYSHFGFNSRSRLQRRLLCEQRSKCFWCEISTYRFFFRQHHRVFLICSRETCDQRDLCSLAMRLALKLLANKIYLSCCHSAPPSRHRGRPLKIHPPCLRMDFIQEVVYAIQNKYPDMEMHLFTIRCSNRLPQFVFGSFFQSTLLLGQTA